MTLGSSSEKETDPDSAISAKMALIAVPRDTSWIPSVMLKSDPLAMVMAFCDVTVSPLPKRAGSVMTRLSLIMVFFLLLDFVKSPDGFSWLVVGLFFVRDLQIE